MLHIILNEGEVMTDEVPTHFQKVFNMMAGIAPYAEMRFK